MNFFGGTELGPQSRVFGSVFIKTYGLKPMFYVYQPAAEQSYQPITIDPRKVDLHDRVATSDVGESEGVNDIDFVDDALLNTAPHNKIEQQLLRGDVIGLALMSGAVLWTAMGAFG